VEPPLRRLAIALQNPDEASPKLQTADDESRSRKQGRNRDPHLYREPCPANAKERTGKHGGKRR
jgi:hypothetical protein